MVLWVLQTLFKRLSAVDILPGSTLNKLQNVDRVRSHSILLAPYTDDELQFGPGPAMVAPKQARITQA